MKIAVITAQFLEEYVRDALHRIHPRCEIQLFIYRDFIHVGELYLELEDEFDGFLVSGPVPKEAIIKRAHRLKKPLASFGTDPQCYYEVFFKVMYAHDDWQLQKGSFDLLEWVEDPKPLSQYLREGSFPQLMNQIYENTTLYTLSELGTKERSILQKHINLWQKGEIEYVVTRFSSIMPRLQQEGIRTYFVYPHLELIRSELNSLIKDVELRKMSANQLAILNLNPKRLPEDGKEISPEQREHRYEQLEKAVAEFSQENGLGFVIQRDEEGINVFSHFKEIRRITDGFRSCALGAWLREKCPFGVSIGYGLGRDVAHAMGNAVSACRESAAHAEPYSYLINEQDEMVGPLREGKAITVSTKVTPYIQEVSRKTQLSTMTVQRILSALERIGNDQVTSQALASTLDITVRSANRLLSNLMRHGEAEILYEKQTATKGRPERVYHILLKNPEDTPS